MYRILIVEDHEVLAVGVKRFLSGLLESSQINIASTGKGCLKQLEEHIFDLLLLDISLPDFNGPELCETIHRKHPGVRIIALTGMIDTTSVDKMKKAGASGYILKTAITDELADGIEAVMRGEIYLSRGLT